MRIIEVPDHLAVRILNQLDDFESIAGELRRINKRLDRSEGREIQASTDLAALTDRVKAGTKIDESIKALVEGIAEELEHHQDPEVQALAASLRAESTKLTQAVQANIP